jgi:N6-adenosine-specific RNA methylase IME4
MNELQTIDGYCNVTKTGITFKRDVSKEEWQYVFDACNHISGCIQFWIGDLLKYREQKWGMYDDVVDQLGYDKSTLKTYKSISENVKPLLRNNNLSFNHHKEVAKLPEPKQIEFLNRAVEEKLTVRDLREEIRKADIIVNNDVKLPQGKFQIFYADPPWKYGNSMPEYFTEQANHYSLMTIEEICNMPILEMADKNAALFMWVTSPILEEAFQVVNAWGFEYKTSFIWDKIKHNMGHYSSVRHEILLLCIRGSYPKESNNLRDSVYSEERTKHSKKPDYFYELIEEMYPNSNKIELFSRNKREGWHSYGNQI